MTKWLSAVLIIVCTGCIPLRTKDSTHHVVLGIGVVSIPRSSSIVPEEEPRVVKAQYLGVLVGDQPGARLGIGYGNSISTIVPTNRNVIIEVSDGPFQPVTVQVHEK